MTKQVTEVNKATSGSITSCQDSPAFSVKDDEVHCYDPMIEGVKNMCIDQQLLSIHLLYNCNSSALKHQLSSFSCHHHPSPVLSIQSARFSGKNCVGGHLVRIVLKVIPLRNYSFTNYQRVETAMAVQQGWVL